MSRPTTARKVTRKTEEKRNDSLDVGLRLTIDGREYAVRTGDLSALDTRELRRQVGYSFSGLMAEFQKDPDVDLIAALVWLARRLEGETSLTYESVADEMGYDVLDGIEFAEAGAEELDEADPEG